MFVLGQNNQIKISRGDSGGFEVCSCGKELSSNDRVLFTVKNKARSARKEVVYIERLLEPCENGSVIITFAPQDTLCMPPGEYQWDLRYLFGVQLNPETGEMTDVEEVITPFCPAAFRVLETTGEVYAQ